MPLSVYMRGTCLSFGDQQKQALLTLEPCAKLATWLLISNNVKAVVGFSIVFTFVCPSCLYYSNSKVRCQLLG